MHSQKGEWDGDEDLGDGVLQSLRKVYDSRVDDVKACLQCNEIHALVFCIAKCVDSLQADMPFLDEGSQSAVQTYSETFSVSNTPAETLKNCNWEIVELKTLLQDAQALKVVYEDCLHTLNPETATPRQMLTKPC